MSTKTQGFASMDRDQLRKLSSSAGQRKNPNKGFGSMTAEQRKENGRKAALKRWEAVKAKRMEVSDVKDTEVSQE